MNEPPEDGYLLQYLSWQVPVLSLSWNLTKSCISKLGRPRQLRQDYLWSLELIGFFILLLANVSLADKYLI